MSLVSQALAWLRTLLLAPHEGRTPTPATAPDNSRALPVGYPSPGSWARALRQARQRRAPHLWPPAEPVAHTDATDTGGPVRAYVLLIEERHHALLSAHERHQEAPRPQRALRGALPLAAHEVDIAPRAVTCGTKVNA